MLSVLRLWVIGSYALDALSCGDLDILIQLAPPAIHATVPAICRAFFNSPAYSRIYVGTPADNGSGIRFEDALLAWHGPLSKWRAAIEAIKPDPKADRAPIATDSIPLRPEQIQVDPDQLKELAMQKVYGRLAWDFVPIGTPKGESMMPPEPDWQDEALLLRCASRFGKKTQFVIPAVVKVMREPEPFGLWQCRSSVELVCGGGR